jgi:hypothetical protein
MPSRRGFLKTLAALIPAAALTKTAAPAKAVTPKPVKAKVASCIKGPSHLKPKRDLRALDTSFFCDHPAEQGMVLELAKFIPNPLGGQYPVVRPGDHSGQPVGIVAQNVVHNCFENGIPDNAGRITTEPTGRPIGRALDNSDEDGYVHMKVQLYVNPDAELPGTN